MAAVLYKIKVFFIVKNERPGLSPGTDNHCRIYCPLFTLLFYNTHARAHGPKQNDSVNALSVLQVLVYKKQREPKVLHSRSHNANINTVRHK